VRLRRPTATSAGALTAELRGSGLSARRMLSVLLTDRGGRPVTLDYPRLTVAGAGRGVVRRVRLRLPAGTRLPADLRAYVLADVFPLGVRSLRSG